MIKNLIGSGDKITLFTLPFIVIGVLIQIFIPQIFQLNYSSPIITGILISILIVGIIIWGWSVFLILTNVPKKQLVTTGQYSIVKHPLYTNVALVVLPTLGLLFHTWLGVFIGIALFIGSKIFAGEEEKKLSKLFGEKWDNYTKKVMIRWL